MFNVQRAPQNMYAVEWLLLKSHKSNFPIFKFLNSGGLNLGGC